jgi:hypothetical protein
MQTALTRVVAMLSILLAAALATLAVAASPAAADDPAAVPWSYYGQNNHLTGCTTPAKAGVPGQWGAWGSYVDGCTVRTWCPDYAVRCRVTGEAWISRWDGWTGQRVTLNSRLRRFFRSGALMGWQDASCSGVDYCGPNPPLTATILPGQSVSEQCNGVRATVPGSATVRCHVFVEYLYS